MSPRSCFYIGLKAPSRSLVIRVLDEYRPEAASLSANVFGALQSAVGYLVNGGRFSSPDVFQTVYHHPPDGKVEDAALVPLVFVGHLVEELSTKSSFVNNIGCEPSVVEGALGHSSSGRPR